MVGHIFGIAGILVGLSKLRNMKGFALLVDTVGMVPDANATRVALTALGTYLKLKIDLSQVEDGVKPNENYAGIIWSD